MELFKLLGIIGISNADAIKALDETSKHGEKTEGKLVKAFGKIGKDAVAVGKTIAKGLAVGAAGVTALVTKSVESYADYEQLVGGVETLFKDSAGKVQAYADAAYKTAGMSANAYMETVTGFSASLLQSLKGDTEAAADKANMAIIDMSDNANKMGTSIESIQNAYQGFAKQNYTMLDNLKLGYGGTKEEMQRLLKDAQKISGIKYDISSYADVVDAIHVIQTEMGITGTTAEEASTTISGSIGMMKAQWQNMLTAMSDDGADFGVFVSNFVGTVSTVVSNLMPVIGTALDGVVQLIEQLAPIIIEEIPNLISQLLPSILSAATGLINSIVENLPDLIDTLVNDALPQLITGVISIINALIEAFPAILQSFIDALPTLIPMLINGVVQMLQSIVDALPVLIPMLIDGVTQMILAICEALPQIVQVLIDALPGIIQSLVDSLLENLPLLIDGVMQMFQSLVDAFPQIIAVLVEVLPDLLQDIVDALTENLPILIEGIVQLVMSIVDALPSIITALLGALPGIIDMIVDCLVENIPILIDGILAVIMGIVEALPDIIQAIIDALPDIVASIINAVIELLPVIIQGMIRLVIGIVQALPQIFSSLATGIVGIFKGIWSGVKQVFAPVGEWFGQIFGKAKDKVRNAWSTVTTFFTNIKNKIVGAFANIKEKLLAPFERARDAVKNIADKIKGFFKGEISLPKMKMPHFSISPAGWKFKDLFDGEIPKLSVKWYAEAMNNPMLLNDPTIFGYNAKTGALQGAGEAGAEVVSGANTLMGMIGDAVENRTAGANEQIVNVLLAILDAIMTGNRDTLKALVAGQTLTWNNREVARMVREYA